MYKENFLRVEGVLSMKQIVLSLLVDNNPGVLARVASLFSRRGYNIDSLSAGVTDSPKYTRITVAAVSYTHLTLPTILRV